MAKDSNFGGWVKKISPDNDEGQWVVNGCQKSKKNEGFALLLKQAYFNSLAISEWFPPICFFLDLVNYIAEFWRAGQKQCFVLLQSKSQGGIDM
jgi:hypothetical protein